MRLTKSQTNSHFVSDIQSECCAHVWTDESAINRAVIDCRFCLCCKLDVLVLYGTCATFDSELAAYSDLQGVSMPRYYASGNLAVDPLRPITRPRVYP